MRERVMADRFAFTIKQIMVLICFVAIGLFPLAQLGRRMDSGTLSTVVVVDLIFFPILILVGARRFHLSRRGRRLLSFAVIVTVVLGYATLIVWMLWHTGFFSL